MKGANKKSASGKCCIQLTCMLVMCVCVRSIYALYANIDDVDGIK